MGEEELTCSSRSTLTYDGATVDGGFTSSLLSSSSWDVGGGGGEKEGGPSARRRWST